MLSIFMSQLAISLWMLCVADPVTVKPLSNVRAPFTKTIDAPTKEPVSPEAPIAAAITKAGVCFSAWYELREKFFRRDKRDIGLAKD